MSKQTKIIPEVKEGDFHTIRSYLEPFLDDKRVRVFRMSPYGSFYAKTAKKPARGTIAFPSDGSLGETTDLRFLREWNFTIIAIPRKAIKKLNEKEEEKET